MNSYHYATLNRGVGGTQTIYVIDQQEVRKLPLDETIALTNLSGAYLARYNENIITSE